MRLGLKRDRRSTGPEDPVRPRTPTEEALFEMQEELRALIAASPLPIFAYDTDGIVTLWNQAAERVFGWSEDEALGVLLPIVQESMLDEFHDVRARVLAGGAFSGYETVRRRKDGSPIEVSFWNGPVRDRSGTVRGVVALVDDITSRRRAEDERERLLAALTASERRYRSLVEATAEIVWVTDANGLQGGLSPGWMAFTGQTTEEAAGAGWLDAVHPADRRRVDEAWASAVDTKSPYETEYRLRAVDGAYRYMVARGVPVSAADGGVREWVGVCIDISVRKRREEALRFLAEASAVLASSLDYRTTLGKVARLAVPAVADWCLLDLAQEDGSAERLEVVHADPSKSAIAAGLKRFGPRAGWETPPARVLRSGEPIIVPELTPERLRAVAHDEDHLDAMRAVEPRSVMHVPLEARGRVLGAVTFVSAESGRVYDEDDLLLATDIARRAALAIDNARLFHDAEERGQAARVLAAIGDGVVLVDGDGVVRLWNAAAEAITGLSPAEVVARPVSRAVPGWAAVEGRIPVAAPASAARRSETVPLDLDGREVWVSISGVGFSEGTVYAFRDLTEERRVDELKAEFVATVSHELRTPLAAVHGAALTLRRDDLRLDDATRDSLLQVVADQSDRLAGIVNDILLASRLETDGLVIGRERVDPAELARRVVDAARAHAPDSIAIELSAPAEAPPVAADPDRVRQVLGNLLDNAVKYSPDGGQVVVALEETEGALRFSVLDRGIGIPATEHERIFERFYRLDPNLTRGVGGTGLGLYICRELVRRMGGRIRVEPREGGGSIFSFELPLD